MSDPQSAQTKTKPIHSAAFYCFSELVQLTEQTLQPVQRMAKKAEQAIIFWQQEVRSAISHSPAWGKHLKCVRSYSF